MTLTKQILIVDDDRETCRLISELVGAQKPCRRVRR